jgi:hypothetical protein
MVEPVMAFATRMMKKLSQPPPKLFYPSFVNFKGFLSKFKEVQRKDGFGLAYNKLRMESFFRKGSLIGTDYNGNKYYEDRNAPYGRTRWVEFPTPGGVWCIENQYDASMVRTGKRSFAGLRARAMLLVVLPLPMRSPIPAPGGRLRAFPLFPPHRCPQPLAPVDAWHR